MKIEIDLTALMRGELCGRQTVTYCPVDCGVKGFVSSSSEDCAFEHFTIPSGDVIDSSYEFIFIRTNGIY